MVHRMSTYDGHVEIRLVNMRLTFDPRNVIPLDDKGNVYPTILITDEWGILDVRNGALMSTRWDMVVVSAPTKIDGPHATGDGWTLDLTDGYSLVEDYVNGNYIVIKQYNAPKN